MKSQIYPKNQTKCILGAALAWALFGLCALAQNVIHDPGFEGQPVGPLPNVQNEPFPAEQWFEWSSYPGSFIDDTVAHSGGQSLRLDVNLVSFPFFYPISRQRIPLWAEEAQNRKWDFSFHAYSEEGIVGGLQFWADVYLLDANGEAVGGMKQVIIGAGSVTAGEWRNFSGSFDVGNLAAGQTYTMQIQILGISNGPTGSLYVDDLSLVGNPVLPSHSETKITNVVRDSGTTTVHFTTSPGLSHRLRGVDSVGLGGPVAEWPLLPGEVLGDGTIKTISETNSSLSRFYVVETRTASE